MSSTDELQSQIKELRTSDGEITHDHKTITNAFCEYFSGIGQKMVKKITCGSNDIKKKIIQQSIFISKTNEKEVIETIMKLLRK